MHTAAILCGGTASVEGTTESKMVRWIPILVAHRPYSQVARQGGAKFAKEKVRCTSVRPPLGRRRNI